MNNLREHIGLHAAISAETIKRRLTNVIKNSGIKTGTIAKETDISIHTIYGICRTTGFCYKPEFVTILKICEYLKVDLKKIFEGDSHG